MLSTLFQSVFTPVYADTPAPVKTAGLADKEDTANAKGDDAGEDKAEKDEGGEGKEEKEEKEDGGEDEEKGEEKGEDKAEEEEEEEPEDVSLESSSLTNAYLL